MKRALRLFARWFDMITALTLLVGTLWLVCGCGAVEYVPATSTSVDSVYANKWMRDSVYLRDSIYVTVQADTVFKYRDRVYYRDRVVRDTLFVMERDTTTVVQEVERKLTRAERLKMNVGGGVLWATPIVICVYILYRKLKK